jgi:hypothetical protein
MRRNRGFGSGRRKTLNTLLSFRQQVRQGQGRGHGTLSKCHQGNRKERPIAVCCIKNSLYFSLTGLSNAAPSGVVRSRGGKNTSTNSHQAAATKDNLPFGGPKCRVRAKRLTEFLLFRFLSQPCCSFFPHWLLTRLASLASKT